MADHDDISPLNNLIREIKNSIADGNLVDALDHLRDLALNGPHDLSDESVALAGRHAHLAREERKDRVTHDQARTERAKIRASALELLDELSRKLTPAAVAVPAPPPAEIVAGWEDFEFEKIIGVNNLRQIAWIEQGVASSRAVCRIHTENGKGSGFLVGERVIMTNNHVIGSADQARNTKVEFNYQLPYSGGQPSNSVRYDLDPDTFFRTSAGLDYTLVAVRTSDEADRPSAESWGKLRPNPHADPVRNEQVAIVQHPNGGLKQIVLTGSAVLQVKPPYLHYSTDTMPGSSGSPVFNDLWQVIAIHHASGPTVSIPGGLTRHSNEGVLMSAIRLDLGNDWPE